MRLPKVTPFLWFDDTAEDAAKLYVSLFPQSELLAVTPGPGGKAVSVAFTVCGQRLIALNGGPAYKHSEAFSLHVELDTQAEVDRLWDALLANGGSPNRCGWLKDRFGLSWQLIPEALPRLMGHPDRAVAGRVVQAMMGMQKLDVAALERAAKGA